MLFRGDPAALWAASPHSDVRPVGPPFTHTDDITVYTDYPVRQPDGALQPRDIVLLAEGGTYTNNTGDTGSVFIDGDRSVMLVTDEDMRDGCGTAGGVTAVRVSEDLTRAEELSEWLIPLGTPAPVCSVHVSRGLDAFRLDDPNLLHKVKFKQRPLKFRLTQEGGYGLRSGLPCPCAPSFDGYGGPREGRYGAGRSR